MFTVVHSYIAFSLPFTGTRADLTIASGAESPMIMALKVCSPLQPPFLPPEEGWPDRYTYTVALN